MRKQKTVHPTGKITITSSEERFPYSSEILMNHGFCIIFLNMALGLLPITIWGTRVKYFKCSISQLYTKLFCLSFIILSAIFVPVVFAPKSDDKKGMTNLVILVLLGTVHIFGFMFLMIRGHFVAKRIPVVWSQLGKLLQYAVVDVYGTKCHLLKEARSFARWAITEYLIITCTTMGSVLAFSMDYQDGMVDSIQHYKLNIYVWLGGIRDSPFQVFQYCTYNVGYFIWQICGSSHVLVTMFLCYIVIVITICLKSVNQQILEMKEKISIKSTGSEVSLAKVLFKTEENGLNIGISAQESIINRLDTISKVIGLVEDITQKISAVWGVSLIVESLILICSGTVNTYNFLSMFQEIGNNSSGDTFMKFAVPEFDEWIGLFITIFTHFLFLFKLAGTVTKMIDEANRSLHLLKQISNHHLPQKIREKIHEVKQDISSSSISISASNFFQVNKFLITSITSQIATYVIVLLQFATSDDKCNNT